MGVGVGVAVGAGVAVGRGVGVAVGRGVGVARRRAGVAVGRGVGVAVGRGVGGRCRVPGGRGDRDRDCRRRGGRRRGRRGLQADGRGPGGRPPDDRAGVSCAAADRIGATRGAARPRRGERRHVPVVGRCPVPHGCQGGALREDRADVVRRRGGVLCDDGRGTGGKEASAVVVDAAASDAERRLGVPRRAPAGSVVRAVEQDDGLGGQLHRPDVGLAVVPRGRAPAPGNRVEPEPVVGGRFQHRAADRGEAGAAPDVHHDGGSRHRGFHLAPRRVGGVDLHDVRRVLQGLTGGCVRPGPVGGGLRPRGTHDDRNSGARCRGSGERIREGDRSCAEHRGEGDGTDPVPSAWVARRPLGVVGEGQRRASSLPERRSRERRRSDGRPAMAAIATYGRSRTFLLDLCIGQPSWYRSGTGQFHNDVMRRCPRHSESGDLVDVPGRAQYRPM